jgi:hypothetical protein
MLLCYAINSVPIDSELPEVSQRDGYIRGFNHKGLSASKISKMLQSLYNIELGKKAILRRLTELRQDPDNRIQIDFKCSFQRPKSEQKWYNIILRLRDEIEAYTR